MDVLEVTVPALARDSRVKDVTSMMILAVVMIHPTMVSKAAPTREPN